MQKDSLLRALDVCIQHIQSGEKLEKVVALYPQWEDQLIPPLEAAQVVRVYAQTLEQTSSDQVSQRANFLYTAQVDSETEARSQRRKRLGRWLIGLSLLVLLLISALALLITAVNATPGDWQYSIKNRLWDLQLYVTQNPVDRIDLERRRNQERLDEITLLKSTERSANILFSDVLSEIQPDKWLIGEQQVRILPDTQIIGDIRQGEYVEIEGFLQADGNITAGKISPQTFIFSGPVEKQDRDIWQVDGLSVIIDPNAHLPEEVQVGEVVRVYARLSTGGSLVAHFIETIQ